MTSHKKMITYLWSFSFGLFTIHNILSFWINTSYFEIDAWNFWYFNLMSKPLAFGHHIFSYKSLFLFLSRILVCAMAFAVHYLFSFWDLHWLSSLSKKKNSGKIYRHKSMQSQDQQNHWLIIHDKVEDLFTTIT